MVFIVVLESEKWNDKLVIVRFNLSFIMNIKNLFLMFNWWFFVICLFLLLRFLLLFLLLILLDFEFCVLFCVLNSRVVFMMLVLVCVVF